MDESWANISQGFSILLIVLPIVFLSALPVARHRLGAGYSLQNVFIRTALDAAIAVSFVGIVVVTMVPSLTVTGGFVNLVPLAAIRKLLDPATEERSLVLFNLVSNVVLFMPLGFFYALRFHRARPIITASITGICISGSIEIFQLLLPGRTVDVDDVIFNATGTLLGALFSVPVARLADRSRSARSTVSDR